MMTRRRKKSLRSGNAKQANIRAPRGTLIQAQAPRLSVRRFSGLHSLIKSEGAFAL
jgi:hypothetical protein